MYKGTYDRLKTSMRSAWLEQAYRWRSACMNEELFLAVRVLRTFQYLFLPTAVIVVVATVIN